MTTKNANLSYYHKQALRERVVAMVIYAEWMKSIQASLLGGNGCRTQSIITCETAAVMLILLAMLQEQIKAGLFGSGGCAMWPYSIGQDGAGQDTHSADALDIAA